MRAVLHIGLAVALVLVPSLCCCQSRALFAQVRSAPSVSDRTSMPVSDPGPAVSVLHLCCSKAKMPVPVSQPANGRVGCCHPEPADALKPADAPSKPLREPLLPPAHQPAKPDVPRTCACCFERPDGALTESQPTVAPPEPTGERLPLAFRELTAGLSKHLSLLRAAHPLEGVGVDVRSTALFVRHVLRC